MTGFERDSGTIGTSGPSRPVRVVVVDDDPLVRAGLSLMLAGHEDVTIVGEAGDGAGVPDVVAATRPDVVLMDIRMPGVDGLAATEALRRQTDPPQVIVLTTFDADEYVLRALHAGASGFLLKDTPPPELVRAILLVAAGDAMLSPAITRRLLTHVADPAHTARRTRATSLVNGLSERERQVAIAIAGGLSNAEIAAQLYLSVATVKAHVSRLLIKLEVTNRVQIALLTHDAELA